VHNKWHVKTFAKTETVLFLCRYFAQSMVMTKLRDHYSLHHRFCLCLAKVTSYCNHTMEFLDDLVYCHYLPV
jgi:hypothetical protein